MLAECERGEIRAAYPRVSPSTGNPERLLTGRAAPLVDNMKYSSSLPICSEYHEHIPQTSYV